MVPAEYDYSNSATFTVNPFTVSPPECGIVYTCSIVGGSNGHDLCSYGDTLTSTSFNKDTGDYSFKSIDVPTFKSVTTVIFEITVTSGLSSETF